jgi:hypothetical protein
MRVRIKRTYEIAHDRVLESRLGHVPPNACWAEDGGSGMGMWVDYAEWYYYKERRLPWRNMQYQLFA